MNRQTIVFTGATSGLGLVAALEAASQGHYLIILARNLKSENSFKKAYLEKFGNKSLRVDFVQCNLNSFSSINQAIDSIRKLTGKIDVLVNNAGLWNTDFTETEDGFEETFQVNLLSPYYLLQSLLPLLKQGHEPKYLITSSGLHQGTINFKDLEYRENWNGFKAYRQSKLGVILLCRLFALKHPSITFCSQHPGVVRTKLGKKFGWFSRTIFYLIGKSATKGAATLIHLIKTPSIELNSGEYYANKKVVNATEVSNNLILAEQLIDTLDLKIKNAKL